MKKIIFFFLVLSLGLSVTVLAQSSPAPTQYSLKTEADFRRYEQDVINTINWLEQTPWVNYKEERKAANTFLMTWLTESPTITLVLNSQTLLDISDRNPELLNIFMGGYLKYALLNKDVKNQYDINQAYVAGIRALVAKYRMESHHVKDKNIDRLARIDQTGKLETWVKNDFNRDE